jgi:hypothetical protein
MSVTRKERSEKTMRMMKSSCIGLVTLAWVALAGTRAMALSLVEKNVVDLLRESDTIAVGTIEKLSDGVDDRGIPYTEVTLKVSESIRGALPDTYTFRQFGLLKPRPTPDGTMVMMPAPEGFPRYASGERVLLFLYPQARRTGLRTTAGLIQGKFALGPGLAVNGTGNEGLFRNVRLDQGLAEESDKRMLATRSGAVNPDAFLRFLRRAVQGRWVETGRLKSPQTPAVKQAPGRSVR